MALQYYNEEKGIFEEIQETENEKLKARLEEIQKNKRVRKRVMYITPCSGCGGFSVVEIIRFASPDNPINDGDIVTSLEDGDVLAIQYDMDV